MAYNISIKPPAKPHRNRVIMMLSEKIIDLLVCFVAFVVFAIVVSIYPEEMFALLIATVLLIGIYAVAKELVKDWLKHNHRFGV